MIRTIKRRTSYGHRWVYVTRCTTCDTKVGGDFVTRESAQAALDAHECGSQR